jgi:hypothetical protein
VTQVNDNPYGTTAHGLAIALALFLACGNVLSDDLATADLQLAGEKVVLDLTGSWEMEGVLPGEGEKKLSHKVHPDCGPAFVPGDVYTDLWRVGEGSQHQQPADLLLASARDSFVLSTLR